MQQSVTKSLSNYEALCTLIIKYYIKLDIDKLGLFIFKHKQEFKCRNINCLITCLIITVSWEADFMQTYFAYFNLSIFLFLFKCILLVHSMTGLV